VYCSTEDISLSNFYIMTLHEGLKCLKYNGNITYLEAFEDYSAPQKIDIDILSVDIIEVNEERGFGIWKFQTQFTWHDHR
jgi:hypothetical protein